MRLTNWFWGRGNHNPCSMVNVESANLFNICKKELLNYRANHSCEIHWTDFPSSWFPFQVHKDLISMSQRWVWTARTLGLLVQFAWFHHFLFFNGLLRLWSPHRKTNETGPSIEYAVNECFRKHEWNSPMEKLCPLCPEHVLQQNLLDYTRRIADQAQLTGSNNLKRHSSSYMTEYIWRNDKFQPWSGQISELHKNSAKLLTCSQHFSRLLLQNLGC
jgi:hypothetical protein